MTDEIRKPERIDEQPKKTPVPMSEYLDKLKEAPTSPVEKEIENATGTVSTLNDTYLLSTGPEAFKNIEAAIASAETSIKINIFSWANDSTGKRFKAQELHLAFYSNFLNISIWIARSCWL